MKEIKAYELTDPDASNERVILIKSGHKELWITVYEDSAYNVGASYATEEEQQLVNLFLRNKEDSE